MEVEGTGHLVGLTAQSSCTTQSSTRWYGASRPKKDSNAVEMLARRNGVGVRPVLLLYWYEFFNVLYVFLYHELLLLKKQK